MIKNTITKKELTQLGISDTGQFFAGIIAIFKHNTGVVLFDILENGEYEVHGASQLNFMKIRKEYLDSQSEEKR